MLLKHKNWPTKSPDFCALDPN